MRARCRTGKKAAIEEIDLKDSVHPAVIRQFADLELIEKANFKFAIDAMHGSGRGVLPKIFSDRGIQYRRHPAGTESAVPGNQSGAD